jgi:hypothetical protein
LVQITSLVQVGQSGSGLGYCPQTITHPGQSRDMWQVRQLVLSLSLSLEESSLSLSLSLGVVGSTTLERRIVVTGRRQPSYIVRWSE